MDDFGHTHTLTTGGNWVPSGYTFPLQGPCYVLRSPGWLEGAGVVVLHKGALHRTLGGIIETWCPQLQEWLLAGLSSGADKYWMIIRNRRIDITEYVEPEEEEEAAAL